MLDGLPSQVGVAKRRISASRIWARMPGHSSPSPSSDSTPGGIEWSTARTEATSTPSARSASATTSASASVFDFAGLAFSVQLMRRAFIFSPGQGLRTTLIAPSSFFWNIE
jgi:hypothetical protein